MFPFSIKTKVAKEDMLALNKVVSRPRITRSVVLLAVMLVIYAAYGLYLYFKGYEIPVFIFVIAALMLAALVAVLLTPLIYRSSVRKTLRKQGETEVTYEFFEDRVATNFENKQSSGRQETAYTGYIKAVETNDDIFLFVSRLSALVIPKRDLSPEQALAVRDAVQKALPKNKYKNKVK
jgi:multidrug efflux pump subunit AcrB